MITQINNQNSFLNATNQQEAQAKKATEMGTVDPHAIVPTDPQAIRADHMQESKDHLRIDKGISTDYFKVGRQEKSAEVQKQDDSVGEMIAGKARAQRIAMKIARGEPITTEDKSFIEANDPGLVLEAERAVQHSKKLSLEMRFKPTNEEKKQFLQQAKINAVGFGGGSAELLACAIDKLDSEISKKA